MINDKSRLVIGVDGGGTKCDTVLARVSADSNKSRLTISDLKQIGRGRGGPANPRATPIELVIEHIDHSIMLAFTQANMPRQRVSAICLACAGAGRKSDQDAMRQAAESRGWADTVYVTHDADSMLAAGSADGAGVVLIAGTGSFAFARDVDGRDVRAGGWGYLLGDEGSGFQLSLAVLKDCARRHDAGDYPTSLQQAMLAELGLANPAELPSLTRHPLPRDEIAALATLVLDAAAQGETSATTHVEQSARELASLVQTVTGRLGLKRFPIVAGGGLLKNDRFRDVISRLLVDSGVHADWRLDVDAGLGAALLAARPIPSS